MKNIIYILAISFVLVGCNTTKQRDDVIYRNNSAEEELQKASEELNRFDKIIIGYYNQIDVNPTYVIKQTEVLVKKIKTDPDPHNVIWNKLGLLFDLRAEAFYKKGDYKNSIKAIYLHAENYRKPLGNDFSFGDMDLIHLACNYVKLKNPETAKSFIDSASPGLYIMDYIIANYYEATGNKTNALKTYLDIKRDRSKDHYFYYQQALNRIKELKKPNPILLNELFYPSSSPNDEICKTDNERRTRIFDLIYDIPEVKSCKDCKVVSIYKEPEETNSKNY